MGYLTPIQAAEKMCPFMTQSGRSYNKCIVGHCMMWRWENGIGPDDIPDLPEGRVPPGDTEIAYKGFCGMAGWPGADQGQGGGGGRPTSMSNKTPSPKKETYTESDRPAQMAEKAIEGTA